MSYPSPVNELWYVCAEDSHGRKALLSGPYDNHGDAAPHVTPDRVLATQTWPEQMGFATFGVLRTNLKPGATAPRGRLAEIREARAA